MWFRRPLSGEQESPTYLWLCAVWPLLVLRPSKKTRCKILLVQVGTLSSSPNPSFGLSVFFLSFYIPTTLSSIAPAESREQNSRVSVHTEQRGAAAANSSSPPQLELRGSGCSRRFSVSATTSHLTSRHRANRSR